MRDEGDYFERRFRDGLSGRLRAAGLQAEVFVWDDFHDRYLISNLVGISLPNGFDTDGKSQQRHELDASEQNGQRRCPA